MREWKWIRIQDGVEAFREYAQTVPTFNEAFGRRDQFTYVVRAIPTAEWDDIVRERRRGAMPEDILFRFIEAMYANDVLSQPSHLSRFYARITQIRQDEPLSGPSGI